MFTMTPAWNTAFVGMFVLTALWTTAYVDGTIVIRPLSTQYVPYDYMTEGDSTKSLYGIDMKAIEASDCDVTKGLVYAAGEKYIHIVDYSNAEDPKIAFKDMIDGTVNDVEICGSKVALLIAGNPGRVDIYNSYDRDANEFRLNTTIPEVGYGPSEMKFTEDCLEMVVANEGQPYETDDGNFEDPEGSVGIIRLENTPPTVNILDFTKFNDKADDFVAEGVRWPYREGTTFSQSLEPESITINSEVKTVAYISLQENNAIAVVDLLDMGVLETIYALGTKSWEHYFIDASDMDKGTNFHKYDIYSFYQPDGIKFFEVDDVGYIATANEGATMSFKKDGKEWSDVQRGKDFVTNDQLSDEVSAELKKDLNNDALLGRLEFSNVDGQNPNDTTKFDKLHFFGGRGISVFLASDMTRVWDSNYIAEFMHVLLYHDVFNANLDIEDPNKQKPTDFFDQESDSRGPDCESIEGGEYNGTRVLFAGVEGTSSIMVFSFAQGSVEPKFESIYRHGGTDKTFSKLLDDRNLGDLNPQELKFIPAEYSSRNTPLLLVTGSVSGTLTMYEISDGEWDVPPTLPPHVYGSKEDKPDGSSSIRSTSGFLTLILLLLPVRITVFI